MDNAIAKQIIGLIKKSSYTLLDSEVMALSICENIVNEGVNLPPEEAIQLENLFEKIKRGGFLDGGNQGSV